MCTWPGELLKQFLVWMWFDHCFTACLAIWKADMLPVVCVSLWQPSIYIYIYIYIYIHVSLPPRVQVSQHIPYGLQWLAYNGKLAQRKLEEIVEAYSGAFNYLAPFQFLYALLPRVIRTLLFFACWRCVALCQSVFSLLFAESSSSQYMRNELYACTMLELL